VKFWLGGPQCILPKNNVKNNVLRFRKFAVAVHPFIQDRVLFCRICRSYAPGAPPTLLRGKLGALPPGPAALLPCTRPSSNAINGLYGHGFYEYGNGYGVLSGKRERERERERERFLFARSRHPEGTCPSNLVPIV